MALGVLGLQPLGPASLQDVRSTFLCQLISLFTCCVPGSMLDIGNSSMSKTDAHRAQNLMWEPDRIPWQGGRQRRWCAAVSLQEGSLGEERAGLPGRSFPTPTGGLRLAKPSSGIHCAWARIPDLSAPWDLAPILGLPPLLSLYPAPWPPRCSSHPPGPSSGLCNAVLSAWNTLPLAVCLAGFFSFRSQF